MERYSSTPKAFRLISSDPNHQPIEIYCFNCDKTLGYCYESDIEGNAFMCEECLTNKEKIAEKLLIEEKEDK